MYFTDRRLCITTPLLRIVLVSDKLYFILISPDLARFISETNFIVSIQKFENNMTDATVRYYLLFIHICVVTSTGRFTVYSKF